MVPRQDWQSLSHSGQKPRFQKVPREDGKVVAVTGWVSGAQTLLCPNQPPGPHFLSCLPALQTVRNVTHRGPRNKLSGQRGHVVKACFKLVGNHP